VFGAPLYLWVESEFSKKFQDLIVNKNTSYLFVLDCRYLINNKNCVIQAKFVLLHLKVYTFSTKFSAEWFLVCANFF